MLELLNNETLSTIFDVVLLLSVIGLWILWWRQVQQRKGIETMLSEASNQLQEATQMLNEALYQIQELQRDKVADSDRQKTSEERPELQAKARFKEKVVEKVSHTSAEESQPTANISQVSKMLRLQREGIEPEQIAEKLNMPLAQVKLMLMLQSSPKL